MTTDHQSGADRFTIRATASDNFAWLRTRLALESTLMAWVRTGISLIGFGFSIAEIFSRLVVNPNVAPVYWPDMPRYVGLTLIGGGVLALVISCFQYVWIDDYLWSAQFQPIAGLGQRRGRTPGFAIAIALAVVGLLAFLALLFHVA